MADDNGGFSSLPVNYVTILDLHQRWLKQQQQQKKMEKGDEDQKQQQNHTARVIGDEECKEKEIQDEKSDGKRNFNPRNVRNYTGREIEDEECKEREVKGRKSDEKRTFGNPSPRIPPRFRGTRKQQQNQQNHTGLKNEERECEEKEVGDEKKSGAKRTFENPNLRIRRPFRGNNRSVEERRLQQNLRNHTKLENDDEECKEEEFEDKKSGEKRIYGNPNRRMRCPFRRNDRSRGRDQYRAVEDQKHQQKLQNHTEQEECEEEEVQDQKSGEKCASGNPNPRIRGPFRRIYRAVDAKNQKQEVGMITAVDVGGDGIDGGDRKIGDQLEVEGGNSEKERRRRRKKKNGRKQRRETDLNEERERGSLEKKGKEDRTAEIEQRLKELKLNGGEGVNERTIKSLVFDKDDEREGEAMDLKSMADRMAEIAPSFNNRTVHGGRSWGYRRRGRGGGRGGGRLREDGLVWARKDGFPSNAMGELKCASGGNIIN